METDDRGFPLGPNNIFLWGLWALWIKLWGDGTTARCRILGHKWEITESYLSPVTPGQIDLGFDCPRCHHGVAVEPTRDGSYPNPPRWRKLRDSDSLDRFRR